jgi:hypothetical protein
MICENCGGNVIPVATTQKWISCQCENCKIFYAVRPDKKYHEETLKHVYGDNYEAVIKSYQNRIKELVNDAKV